MADQLATPADLASFLQLGAYASLTPTRQATLTMLVELATAKVQRAAGYQRILAATSIGAMIDLSIGYDDDYVLLPQQPVRSVASVALNGVAITDWVLSGGMLWRARGWYPVMASATMTFRKSLQPWQRFDLESRSAFFRYDRHFRAPGDVPRSQQHLPQPRYRRHSRRHRSGAGIAYLNPRSAQLAR